MQIQCQAQCLALWCLLSQRSHLGATKEAKNLILFMTDNPCMFFNPLKSIVIEEKNNYELQ